MKKMLYSSFGCLLHVLTMAQDPCSADTTPPELETVAFYKTTISSFSLEATVSPLPVLKSYSDNCTAPDHIELALRVAGTGSGFPDGQTMLSFDCDYQNVFVNIEIWARDDAGNTALANELIYISEPGGLPYTGNPCKAWVDPSLAIISARTLSGDFIHGFGASLGFTIHPSDTMFYVYTDQTIDKWRSFPAFGQGFITLSKDKFPLNGVTTLDLVQINKHILGIEKLDSPYKIIAADANRSGTISTFDLLEFRKLLLGIYDKLPHNTSWRFLPEDHIFQDSTNPFPGMPVDTFYHYFGAAAGVAFNGWYVGIKVGDINFSADPTALTPKNENRSITNLFTPDRELLAGDEVEIPIQLPNNTNLSGLQFSLGTDTLKAWITSVRSDVLPGFSKEAWRLSAEGRLRLAWFDVTATDVRIGEPVILLKIKALENVRLQEVLFLDDEALLPEIVLSDLSVSSVKMSFQPVEHNVQGCLVFPNPFTDQIDCQFKIQKPGWVRWQLLHANGSRVMEKSRNVEAGYQNWHFTGLNDLPAGIYFYLLQTEENIFSGSLSR